MKYVGGPRHGQEKIPPPAAADIKVVYLEPKCKRSVCYGKYWVDYENEKLLWQGHMTNVHPMQSSDTGVKPKIKSVLQKIVNLLTFGQIQ